MIIEDGNIPEQIGKAIEGVWCNDTAKLYFLPYANTNSGGEIIDLKVEDHTRLGYTIVVDGKYAKIVTDKTMLAITELNTEDELQQMTLVNIFTKEILKLQRDKKNEEIILDKKIYQPVIKKEEKQRTNINAGVRALLICLCFIPLIGAFIGLVIIIIGTSLRYKGLIIGGIAGILFTVAVYGSLFYMGIHRGVWKDMDRNFAKAALTNVVRGVEYYKIVNGNYPDSLTQITNDNDMFFSIQDPYSKALHNGRIKHDFYYKKEQQKYYLLSVGEDGIPFTKDDIVPPVSTEEIKKIGLVIKER